MIILILLCLHLGQIIFREMVLVLLIILLCLQGSSLWGTLIVVPTRLVLIYSFRIVNIISGLLIIIYVIVFIGGLLIFLIRVASITPQEQRLRVRSVFAILTIIFVTPILFVNRKLSTSLSWIILSIWFWGERNLIIVIIIVLLLTLFVVTKFFIVYKGFVRSI